MFTCIPFLVAFHLHWIKCQHVQCMFQSLSSYCDGGISHIPKLIYNMIKLSSMGSECENSYITAFLCWVTVDLTVAFLTKPILVCARCLLWNQLFVFPQPKNQLMARKTGSRHFAGLKEPHASWVEGKFVVAKTFFSSFLTTAPHVVFCWNVLQKMLQWTPNWNSSGEERRQHKCDDFWMPVFAFKGTDEWVMKMCLGGIQPLEALYTGMSFFQVHW